MSLAELRDVEFREQKDLVDNAIQAWLPNVDPNSNPCLMNATLTGDHVWNENQQHSWIGVQLHWQGIAESSRGIICDGQIICSAPGKTMTVSWDFSEYVFMRVFADLAEFEIIIDSSDLSAMHGLRQARDLEQIHQYYEENL